ncbi:MAG TPA: hypothetical protein DEA96_16915 [Leptospiraceae bacterium]|nr:hypothetical protein [Spirochaetaceae bacterium]HBS06654.1 hypothetical protein [Leptospiraceae bacterium]|tara:strand:+ start:127358 stop:127882 length:525 start_codon:yes stop_codon:yes gene_type:complete
MDIDALKKPAPRELSEVRPFLGRNRMFSKVLIGVAVVLFGLAMLRFYLKGGGVDLFPYGVLIALALAAIPLYFAWANAFIASKMEKLLTQGIHTRGSIVEASLSANVLAMKVEFQDRSGINWLGKSAIFGALADEIPAKGSDIDLLYLPDNSAKFAVLTSSGVGPGKAKRADPT